MFLTLIDFKVLEKYKIYLFKGIKDNKGYYYVVIKEKESNKIESIKKFNHYANAYVYIEQVIKNLNKRKEKEYKEG